MAERQNSKSVSFSISNKAPETSHSYFTLCYSAHSQTVFTSFFSFFGHFDIKNNILTSERPVKHPFVRQARFTSFRFTYPILVFPENAYNLFAKQGLKYKKS